MHKDEYNVIFDVHQELTRNQFRGKTEQKIQ